MDRVSLSVERGEIFGLIGPNGAGKSTLVRLLCTLVLPSSGQARVCDHDLADEAAIKARVGLATGEERSFYWRLSGRDNLRFYGILQGLPSPWVERRLRELDHILELGDVLDKRFDHLSTGMRRRLDLARALLHRPAVLFLDEPTRSLDPGATARFHEQIVRIAQRGQTIFLVTHQLDEAETLCDRVAIMHRGQLQAIAPVEALRRAVAPRRRYRLIVTAEEEGDPPPWADWPWPTQTGPAPAPGQRCLQVELPVGTPLEAILDPLHRAGLGVQDICPAEASLEEIFQRFTTEEERSLPIPVPVRAAAPGGPPTNSSDEPVPAGPADAPLPGDPPPRLPPAAALVRKVISFLRRDVQVELSYRLATILRILGILFSVASFYFVARLFGAAASPLLASYGGNYFTFVLIGIAFAGYQSVGLFTFAGVIRTGQIQGTLESMLTTPTQLETILFASAVWSFLQASLHVVVYFLFGAILFGAPLQQVNLGPALLTLLISIAAFSGLGILSAGFILVAKRGNPVNYLFSGLSTLLSGVYYPVEILPKWLRSISALLPMTHSLRAMRIALIQGGGLAEIAPELATLGVFTLAVLPGGLLAFRWALRRARIEGTLTQF